MARARVKNMKAQFSTIPSTISVRQEIAEYKLHQINAEIRLNEDRLKVQEKKVEQIKAMVVNSSHVDVMV